MDKLKMETSDMAAENIEKIGALFPSAVTEMRGEDGSIKKGVNFEMLKQLLSPDVVEEGDERYEFTWVGKKQAIAEAARPTTKTLRPVKEDSRNWDATENLYIEGDNLEVLKILQESYLGKVKMIYIDPPYNTGHDFIYRDDFGMSREEWSEKSGELSEDGDRLFENTESNGRFHSDWCSMTYSRLMLARNLLTEDGVVFISLDDGEIENLREICNEVFGEQNFLAQCVRKRRDSQANLSKNISPIHEYVVLYAKSNGNLLNKISAHINLVKKIAALGITLTGTTATNSFVYVEGVDIYKNKAPTARLGFEIKGKTGTRTMVRKVQGGDDLYTLSGELDEYADRFVILPDGIDGRDNSVTFLNGLKLYAGQISGNEQMTALQRRIQIRETIRTHIQRERELYPRGIKVLSLFFIDEVSKYRLYDGDNDDGRNGEYAKMFEEEYENVVGQMQRQFGDDAYLHYLDGIDVHKTHQGYFSIDKKKGKKARFVEGKIDRKTQLSDDVDAYDLIMKDKERLLSLDEPVRFIFSHSALREGWDNPNVFQICTLKPQSESEIRSRQEIGRGLRLCVNQQGERMDESVLGRDVQELNKLTLITDLEYGKFAEALQTGLAESLADRPQKVDTQLFVGRTLVDANGEQVHVTQDLANAIYEDLIQNDYVKRGKLTDKYFADKEIGSFHVASEVSGYADSVVRILSGVYDAHTMAPENAHSNNVQAIVDEEKLHKAEFLNLWNRINHKSFYTVQFDTPELIDHSIRALDSKLNVTRVQINLEYGEQTARLESREQLEQGKGFQKARSDRESAKYAPLGSVRYDLVGKLVEETGLTRATVAAILRGIAPQTFSQFRINPEEFILKAARLINDEKATQIIEHITYNRLDAAYDQDVFTRATLRGKLDVNAMEANRSLYSHVIYDSDNERRFAQELDVSDQVAVYVKLPGSFYISTPVGKYNPDWAIAFNEGSVKHIYFVAETKGNLDTMELRGVENAKIECSKKHFAAISNGSVVYSVVDNYSTLMQLVSN